MTTTASRCTRLRTLPGLPRINALGLCAACAALSAMLWPVWRHDDNLTHGLFLPLLSAILLAEARRDPDPRFLQPGPALVAGCAMLLLGSLSCGALGVVYASALGWTHAMAQFLLSTGLVLLLAAGWLGFADRRVRLLPFNGRAFAAVLLWLFAGPPPPGTYARLAFHLQTLVTRGVVHTLNLLGIAAYRSGNVIELARTSVGVSEACSGVRSLISCTVAGLFLSALLVRRPRNRALILLVSPATGLGMNFLRSLLLTLLAQAGADIGGPLHDLTGACVLLGTTLLVTALALWLHRREARGGGGTPPAHPPSDDPPPVSTSLHGMLAAALAVGLGGAALLTFGSGPQEPAPGQGMDLAALLPPPPSGWTVTTLPELPEYDQLLHTHALIDRVYSAGQTPDSERLTLYLAYWRPGQAPVSLVDAHTPDSCWPGTGWEPKPVPDERAVLGIGGRTLAPAECRRFAYNRYQTQVWFWHLYGGRPLTFVDPYSALRLFGLAWRYGFSPPKDQLFVRVSSNRPWREIASQPTLRQFFENLKPLGL